MGFLDDFGLKKVIQILRTKFSEIDHVHLGSDLRSAVPIERGGTGAEDAFTARLNLGAQAAITGGASSILATNLTASRALISNSSGKVAVSDVTSTELGYLDGVTSNIQTQLNAKIEELPVASESQAGIVSTGAQTFAGAKTINAELTCTPKMNVRSTESLSELTLGISGNTYHGGAVSLRSTDANRLALAVSHKNSGGTDNVNYWDAYYLPDSGTNNATTNYKIITTNNLTDIPDADASTRGLVSTGDQTFAGDKTFNGDIVVTDTLSTGQNIYTTGLRITNTTGNGSSLLFRFSDAPSANSEYARIYMGSINYGGQLHFRQYSGTSSAKTSYYEQYDLPTPDEGRTSTGTYNILTTKPSWTLSSGVATSFNIPNGSRHMVVVVGSAATRDGLFLLRASSTGSTSVSEVYKGSSLTYTNTTNDFTITAAGGVATIMFITLVGNPVTKN